MTHGLRIGLDEAIDKLSDQKVDASGMDSYTQEISKVYACPLVCYGAGPGSTVQDSCCFITKKPLM